MPHSQKNLVVALSGGVGGAKLALGLSRVLPESDLMLVVNTGDDFEHLGLHISPDIDTILYTLGGLANPATGWGRRDESWNFMKALNELGGATWFQLGDMDLAIHVERSWRLRSGETLSRITDDFARRFAIAARIVPMSDDPVRTKVRTPDRWLNFQNYFVEHKCAPVIQELAFEGAEQARPHPDFVAALNDPRLRAVILCPSNPFLSIDPILAIPGLRDMIRKTHAPVMAVAPIIGGEAIKGPTAKIMRELGLKVDAATVAELYNDLIDGYILDPADRASALKLPMTTVCEPALMVTLEDRERLARKVLQTADDLRAKPLSRLVKSSL